MRHIAHNSCQAALLCLACLILFLCTPPAFSQQGFPYPSLLSEAEHQYRSAGGEQPASTFAAYAGLLCYYAPDSAAALLRQAINTAGTPANRPPMSSLYQLLARSCFNKGEYQNAGAFYDSSLVALGAYPPPLRLSEIYSEAGYNLAHQSRFDTALTLSYKALELTRAGGIKSALALNTICIVNYILKNLTKANEYCNQALAAANAQNNEFELGRAYGHRGIIDLREDRFASARAATNKAITIWTKFGYRKGVAGLYDNLAMIERFSGNTAAALQNHFASLAIRTEISDRAGIASSKSNIGLLLLGQKRYTEALSNFLAAVRIRKEAGDIRGLANVTELLSRCYEEMGDNKNALAALKERNRYSDSLFSESRSRYQQELEARYEAGARDYRIKLLQEENTTQDTTISVFIAVTAAGALFALLLFAAFYVKKKAARQLEAQNRQIMEQKDALAALNQQLQKANMEKDRLFNIIAHDLKSPFQVLLAYPEVIRLEANEKSVKELLDSVAAMETAGRQVYRLVENLLNWSRLSLGRLEVIRKPAGAEKIIFEALEDFSQLAEFKKVSLFPAVEHGVVLNTDAAALGIVLRNLLSNAIKFTPEQGNVTLEVKQHGSTAAISVVDTGVGMTEQIAASLFTGLAASTQGTAGEQGTGLGMMICSELVKLLNGQIEVKSRPGAGTTVTITLPTV